MGKLMKTSNVLFYPNLAHIINNEGILISKTNLKNCKTK